MGYRLKGKVKNGIKQYEAVAAKMGTLFRDRGFEELRCGMSRSDEQPLTPKREFSRLP